VASRRLIVPLGKHRIPRKSGNKAANLHHLKRKKRLIPNTYVCTWDAYERYLANDHSLIDELKNALAQIIQHDKKYAVRSSANIEDTLERSFAGQFKTALNVSGINEVFQAIWSVWSSTQSQSVLSYLENHQISFEELKMGVIIQEMISPMYSGVSLSKNPVTGTDETVVEAVQGLGSQLVQGGITPDRWVNKWGYWMEKPSSESLPLSIVEEIVNETREIEFAFGYPVDLEWVFDGELVYWLQIREITALSKTDMYSNYLAREMIPGMIKPLIFSVNIPLINGVWIDWLSEITGDLDLEAEDLARHLYYRVYFNMGALGKIFTGLGFPKESVEMLMGILPRGAARPPFKPTLKTFLRLPWMITFAIDKWFFSYRMKRALGNFERRIKKKKIKNLQHLSGHELLNTIDGHYALIKQVAYYNVIGPLMMGMYNSVFARQLLKLGVEFPQFDLTEGLSIINEYDPNVRLESMHQKFINLPENIQEQIKTGILPDELENPEVEEFVKEFKHLMDDFGHLSDSGNDFSTVPWRETPEMVLGLIHSHVSSTEYGSRKIRFSDLEVSGIRKQILKLFYHRAREFRLLREEVSSLYTYGYGLFRYYYLAVGKLLTERGVLDQPEDIYYLTDTQIRTVLDGESLEADTKTIVRQHKENMKKYERVSLPTVIFGEEVPLVGPETGEVLVGAAVSVGMYTGKVKVVYGLQDLQKVQDGDVLVVPYSEVSWTPLFSRAGALVAESGGLLSHTAIVAREYNIPAVVNVDGATTLKDNTIVTVDGNQGKIIVHDGEEQD